MKIHGHDHIILHARIFGEVVDDEGVVGGVVHAADFADAGGQADDRVGGQGDDAGAREQGLDEDGRVGGGQVVEVEDGSDDEQEEADEDAT